jgi:choice-of-anchor B domain-containing protein
MRSSSKLVFTLLALAAPVRVMAQIPPQPTAEEVLRTVEAPCIGSGCIGDAIAVADGTVFVAVPNSIGGPGSVYAYSRAPGGWTEVARLTADDAAAGDRFGKALAASGSTLAVWRPGGEEAPGTIFAFERTGQVWSQVARLRPSDALPSDSAGFALALDGGSLAVGAPGAGGGTGVVYVFHRGPDGRWTEEAELTATAPQPGSGFGRAVALRGDSLLVGAPLLGEGRGGGYLFVRQSGVWRQDSQLLVQGADPGDLGGARAAFWRDWAILAAPGESERVGAVFLFERPSSDAPWFGARRLMAPDGRPSGLFGSSLAPVGDELWVGAPIVFGPATFPPTVSGAVYRFSFDPLRADFTQTLKLEVPGAATASFVGAGLAANGGVVAIGMPGEDFETGTVAVFSRDGSGDWRREAELAPELATFARITGREPLSCAEGKAADFECGNMELLSFLPVSEMGGARGVQVNDIWGWVDSETGREYALVGRVDGTSFVDVTDAANPRYLGDLPLTEGAQPAIWRDIKVYRDHAFVVADGAGAHGVQIFDLTQLRTVGAEPLTFEETAHYDGIFSAHNIVINEGTGFAYAVGNGMGGETCGGALHMIDIRDPRNPSFAGCFADPQTGMGRTGYTHDAQCVVYHGPDERYRGREICLGSNETMLSIADVTDKAAPVAIARASYPNAQYTHQGWLTDDHRYFYQDDEGDEIAGVVPRTRTIIWDVAELDDPVVVAEYLGPTGASDHNLFIQGDLMFQSNYVSGLRVLDISDRASPVEIGFFDSVPNSENAPGFSGSWSNYPYFPSGTIVFTSMQEGLFVVRPRRPVS